VERLHGLRHLAIIRVLRVPRETDKLRSACRLFHVERCLLPAADGALPARGGLQTNQQTPAIRKLCVT
jgi:hypothetical protein